MMKSIWEQIALRRPLEALQQALLSQNISLQREFATFALWNFYTGARADTVAYYADGSLFPPLPASETQTISTNSAHFQRTASSYTMRFLNAARNSDSTYFIVTNVNTDDALSATHAVFAYTLDVSAQSASGWAPLPNGVSYQFSVSDPSNWKIVPVQSGGFSASVQSAPFPNPFDPQKTSLLFPMKTGDVPEARLYIFSTSMELVAELLPRIVSVFGKTCYEWNGRNNKGAFVTSGVYFYYLEGDGISIKGKVAVLR